MTPKSFQDVRDFIETALERRQEPGVAPELIPSDYWLHFASLFKYVRSLPDWELKNIRRHTYHINGDNYIRYMFYKDSFQRSIQKEYEDLCGILVCCPDEGADGIGFDLNGRRVSEDIIRYMAVLDDVIEAGLMKRDAPARILEIGGGYGGLAAVVSRFNPASSYTIVDLEETMFFQAVHLANQFGFERLRLCSEGLPVDEPLEAGCFYLVPQYKSDSLSGASFDFAVNQQSMQEMNLPQVEHYCKLLSSCVDRFYSCNLDQHPPRVTDTMQLVTSLRNVFEDRFKGVTWRPAEQTTIPRLAERLIFRRQKYRPHTDGRIPRVVYACRQK